MKEKAHRKHGETTTPRLRVEGDPSKGRVFFLNLKGKEGRALGGWIEGKCLWSSKSPTALTSFHSSNTPDSVFHTSHKPHEKKTWFSPSFEKKKHTKREKKGREGR